MFYLARHGETEWNRDGRMQGRLGGPLTEKGLAQARRLGAAARALGVRAIVSSPLERAVITAGIVAETARVPHRICAAIVETDFGECSGLTEAEIANRHPGLRAAREADKWHHRWPGGESYADMLARLPASLIDGPATLVIAHQSMNRVITHRFGPAAIEDVLRMAQPSDVMLRLDGTGAVAHARIPSDDRAPEWAPGLCATAPSRLN